MQRSQKQGEALNFTANDTTLGDGWIGVQKTFVIVYRYTTDNIFTDVIRQNLNYELKYRPPLSILSAVYGRKEVTEKARTLTSRRQLHVPATDNIFGDSWEGNPKSLVILYQYGLEEPMLSITQELSTANIDYTAGSPRWTDANVVDLQVLGASYGLHNVTKKLSDLVSRATDTSVMVEASDKVFGDGWISVTKTLVTFYSYGPGTVRTAITVQGSTLQIPKRDPDGQLIPLHGDDSFLHNAIKSTSTPQLSTSIGL